MPKIETIIEHAERHCREQGVRFTNKRKQVLSGLLASQKAMSAYELVDYCKQEYGESMPAMSVYRILDFLSEEGLVHKLNLANKYVACSHISCNHAHEVPQFLICNQCQQVEEITLQVSTISALKENVKKAGYHMISPQLEINCICDDCIKQQHQQ